MTLNSEDIKAIKNHLIWLGNSKPTVQDIMIFIQKCSQPTIEIIINRKLF